MNLEPYSNELNSASDAFAADDPSDLLLPQGTPPAPRSAAPEADSSDEGKLSRAATLLIGTDAAETPDGSYCNMPMLTLKYIQGVVQEQRVHIITNLLQGESQTLFQPQMVWTIGRNREAALPLQDRAMSRRHAVILYLPNAGFQLIDLNSMNGSFLNGNRIQQRAWLKDGDCVRLGSTDFVFFLSCSNRQVGTIHPEVLARFNASKYRPGQFIDYSALEEPEILFKTARS